MSKGRFEQQKEKGGKGKVVLIIVLILLGLIAAAAIAGVIYYNYMLDQINHVEVPKISYTTAPTESQAATEAATEGDTVPTETEHVPSSEDYINFLVVGQASRYGETERAADTMMLFTLNTYEKTLTQTSILRDSFVKPPDYMGKKFGRIKLTMVYHLGSHYEGSPAGSMELMNMTLYNNFGIEVDHNIEISFDAFMDIVNALGGIEIELTQAEADYLNDDDRWVLYDVEPGLQKLDGMAALCYARMRKAEGDGESDIKRTERQRKFVEAIMEKAKNMSLKKLQKIANKVLPSITTSMTKDEITDMLLTFLPMITEVELKSGGTCPASGWGDMVDIYKDGMIHSVIRFDENVTKREMRAITEGETYE